MKGRGAVLWASRGRNRNTSASSAAARSLTSSPGSAPSSVTTVGTTRVSTPSLLAQTRSTRRPADASGQDEEGHASRRTELAALPAVLDHLPALAPEGARSRRYARFSTTARQSRRDSEQLPTRGPVQPTAAGLAPFRRARGLSGAVHPQVFEGDTTAGWQCGTGKRGLTPATRPTGRAPQGVAPSARPQTVHDVRVL
jgi:hypothetical protein